MTTATFINPLPGILGDDACKELSNLPIDHAAIIAVAIHMAIDDKHERFRTLPLMLPHYDIVNRVIGEKWLTEDGVLQTMYSLARDVENMKTRGVTREGLREAGIGIAACASMIRVLGEPKNFMQALAATSRDLQKFVTVMPEKDRPGIGHLCSHLLNNF